MAIEDSGFGISSIVVQDNSIRTVTAGTTLNILPSLHPVFASDGKANKVVECGNFNEVLSKYGSDFTDIATYGQQNLNAEMVYAAGGMGYICRLLPDDAKTAHLVVKVGIKAKNDIPLYQKDGFGEFILDEDGNKITVKAKQTREEVFTDPDTQLEETRTVEEEVDATTSGIEIKLMIDSANEDELDKFPTARALASKFSATGTDAEDYMVIPLFFLNYYSAGKSGTNYGLRLINDFLRDAKVADGRRYQLFLGHKTNNGVEVLSSANGLSFSFNPKATVSKTIASSEYLQKIYQNYDGVVEKQIAIEPYLDNYAILTKTINDILSQEPVLTEGIDPDFVLDTPQNVEDFDFVYGFNKEGMPYDNVVVAEDSVDLTNWQFLQKGNDGALEGKSGEELQNERNILLKKFFAADIDTPTIMNVLKCDAGIVYDANYPTDVKQAMAGLITWRRDICVVFDCGFTENLEQAVVVAKGIRQFAENMDGGENCCIVPHCGLTADRVTNVRVTGSYEMAYGIHRLYRVSPYAVYAGQQNGDAGCVRKTIFDWVVEESKPRGYQEKLAKQNNLYWAVDLGKALSSPATGNYTGRNIYFYSNASLYTERISKLAEFRNGILVNDIRRVLKLILVKYTFDNDGASAAIAKATEELSQKLTSRYPSNIVINYNLYQSERDRLLNVATCELSVLFPDIFETWNCIITVDRQNG